MRFRLRMELVAEKAYRSPVEEEPGCTAKERLGQGEEYTT
jgi:hypothetical protein